MNGFAWLLRRELWEWKSLVWVPVLTAALVVGPLAWMASSGHLRIEDIDPQALKGVIAQLTPARLDVLASLALLSLGPVFAMAASLLRLFYTADALYGERRDRSILFWKSLPVSDLATVLAKLVTALVVVPALALAALIVTQLVAAVLASLAVHGLPDLLAHLWNPATWGRTLAVELVVYGAGILWYLPMAAFCLLVSAAVPRSPLLVIGAVPLGVALVEHFTLSTHPLSRLIVDRTIGLAAHVLGQGHGAGFTLLLNDKHVELPGSVLDLVHPLEFLAEPEVWAGLVVGAALVWAAAWVRRYRDAAG